MITITGHSDDIIQVTGEIHEEFGCISNCDDDPPFVLGCSDGMLIRCRYDEDGIWRFTVLRSGRNDHKKHEGSVEDDTNDRIENLGAVRWVVLGKRWSAN